MLTFIAIQYSTILLYNIPLHSYGSSFWQFIFTTANKTSMNIFEHVFFLNVWLFLEGWDLGVELYNHRKCTSKVLQITPNHISTYILNTSIWYLSLFHTLTNVLLFFSVLDDTLLYFLISLIPEIFLRDFSIMLTTYNITSSVYRFLTSSYSVIFFPIRLSICWPHLEYHQLFTISPLQKFFHHGS